MYLCSMRYYPYTFLRYWLILFLIAHIQNADAQQVIIDEDFSDWLDPTYSDNINDGSINGIDLKNLYIANDDTHIYISFELDSKILLQNYFGLSLYIDIDNDLNTGNLLQGIGADLIYPFDVSRNKTLVYNNTEYIISHPDIGFMALPSVNSDRFELRIQRKLNASGNSVDMESDIRIVLSDINGDVLPDETGGVLYSMNNTSYNAIIDLEKYQSDDIRVMSFNVKQDAYFEDGSREAINRIIKATNPDIIAFQEIYDHTAAQTENQVATALNVSSNNLHSARVFPDIILVSKFPILDVGAVAGNGIFKVDLGDRQMMLVNCHLPCCDNDEQREEEVADILNYIENAKNNNASVTIDQDSPIIILGDMNFVGNSEQPQDMINGQTTGPDWGNKMEDAKPITTGESAAFTWYQPFSSFYPGRLDYLIYSGSVLKAKNKFNLFTASIPGEILNLYDLESSDSAEASDHLAMIVDFDKSKISSTTEIIAESWLIYPNPSDGIIHIGDNIQGIEIRDQTGRLLMTSDYPYPSLDISQLASGIYVISRILKGKSESRLFQKR